MTEYTLTSSKWEGFISLKYHDSGFVSSAEYPEVMDRESLLWFSSHFPVHETMLEWISRNSTAKVVKVEVPVTFEAFWSAYGNKRGSKPVAQMLWDGEKRTITKRPITLPDRQDIMKMVKAYSSRYQGEKKEWQPLATSFLNQRLWEGEMETIRRRPEVDYSTIWQRKAEP